MQWNDLYPANLQPELEDIAAYIGGEGEKLWRELLKYMERAYRASPKLSYSGCSLQPGWNVKFAKSGQAFGTIYPEQERFSVLLVLAYRLLDGLEALPLSDDMRARWAAADDYMKLGKCLMFAVRTENDLNDYKALMSLKLAPKETA